jgi:hypothetical protein
MDNISSTNTTHELNLRGINYKAMQAEHDIFLFKLYLWTLEKMSKQLNLSGQSIHFQTSNQHTIKT